MKNKKMPLIIREMSFNSNKYEINGIDLTKAVFYIRKSRELFKIVAPGDYTISREGANTYLVINNTAILIGVISVQIVYFMTPRSGKYETGTEPDINTFVAAYNELVDDFKNLWSYIQKQTFVSDTSIMPLIFPLLGEGETWIYKDGEMKAIILYDAIEELKKSVEQVREEIKTELENKINEFDTRINMLIAGFRTEIRNIIDAGKSDINSIINTFETDWGALVTQSKKEINDLTVTNKATITELTNISKTEITTHTTNQKNTITTLINNSKTEINTLVQNEKTNITNLAEEKKDEIRDLATQIVGFDPKQIEDDIKELQEREGGDIIRVKFSVGLADAGGGNMQRYMKVSDLNGIEITKFDKSKKYIGIIDITENTGNIYGQVSLYDDGNLEVILRPGKYNGAFAQSAINFTDFFQYSLQELYYEQEMNGGTGSWAFNNSYLPAVSFAPGLFSTDVYGDIKNSLGSVNMNMLAYTDTQIIDNLNKIYTNGQNAQINMFMYRSGITPDLSCDTSGYMTFEPVSTTMILKFYPAKIDGYSVTSAECRIPMKFDSTKNRYIMNNAFELRNIGAWRFYGTKQKLFTGNVSGTLNSTTQLKNFSNSNFGFYFPILSMKGIRIEGTITTTRINATPPTGTFPFIVELPVNSSGIETIILTYKTNNGSWETISINGLIETANTSSQVSFTFYLRARSGAIDSGDVTINIQRIDAIFL